MVFFFLINVVLFIEMQSSKDKVVIIGSGPTVTKAITTAEIVKRKIKVVLYFFGWASCLFVLGMTVRTDCKGQ